MSPRAVALVPLHPVAGKTAGRPDHDPVPGNLGHDGSRGDRVTPPVPADDGVLGPGKEGIGVFVRHARADVIPCYISGAWRAMPKGCVLPRPRKIRISYGPVIRYEEFDDCPKGRRGYAMISARIMERIAALQQQLES